MTQVAEPETADDSLHFPPAGPRIPPVRRHLPPTLITDSRVLAVIEHVERDHARAYPLAELAAHAEVSASHLHRLFVETMGETIGGFVRRERMDVAAIHLLSSPDAIQDIAATVGYGSLAAFNHAFRRQFGVAPTCYRELARQAVIHVSADDHARARRVRVESCEALPLIGMRFYGNYGGAKNYWQRFAGILQDLGIALEGLQAFARIVDNPQITPDGLIRYHCAVRDPGLPDPLPPPLTRHLVHAGRYATLRQRGQYAEVLPAYFAINPVWMHKHGERFGVTCALERYDSPPWAHDGGEPSITLMVKLR